MKRSAVPAQPAWVPHVLRLAVCSLLGGTAGLQAQTGPDKPVPAAAADPAATRDKAPQGELPTVTVTATRTTTDLLKTPVAVTALSPDDLQRDNVKALMDLGAMVPNLQLGLSNADSGVLAAIRGVTSTNFTEIGDPAVGIHIDGIYSPRPQGSLALMFDLDQVEVLRGAQGTLFGRNSTAGVINIIPARPEFNARHGWASVQLGSYNARELRAVYNLGLTDTFAVRAAVMAERRDSWLTQVPDLRDRGVKLPTDDGAGMFTPDGLPDADQRLNRPLSKSEYYNNSDQRGARVTARWAIRKDLEWTSGLERYENRGAGDIGLKDCEMAEGTPWACGPEGQWYAVINVPGKLDMTIDTWRNTLTWNVSERTELAYKMAYAKQRREQHHDDDGGQTWLDSEVDIMYEWGNWGRQHAIDWASYTLDSNYRSWVHELQLKQRGSDWRYVAGLFTLNEKNAIDFAQDNLVAAPYAMPQGQFYGQPDRRVESKAFFIQGDKLLAKDLTGTLGMRYTRDRRSDEGGITAGLWDASTPWYYNGLHTPPVAPGLGTPHNGTDLTFGMGPFAGIGVYPAPTENSHNASWSETTWRAGLQYELDSSRMVFMSYATGYRPGGFGDKFDTCGGGTCTDGSTQKFSFLEYGPERTKNLEFGYKGRHLDNKLDLSAVAFFTKYQGMHVTGMNAVGQRMLREGETCPDWNPACDIVTAWKTENIGDADIRGIELEFKALPWAGGNVSGFFALLDTKVKSYPTYDDNWMCGYREMFGAEPCAPIYLGDDPSKRGRAIRDVTGNQLPYAPKYALGLSVTHDFALGGLTVSPTISARWQSKMYFTVRNLDNPKIGDYQDSYTNWNASVRIAPADGRWDVELWGTNLTDNVIKNWMGQGNAGGYTYNSYNPPRMVGVRGTWYF